ncbi:MAG: helicase associated domain-containing protein [Paraclostridium sp.]
MEDINKRYSWDSILSQKTTQKSEEDASSSVDVLRKDKHMYPSDFSNISEEMSSLIWNRMFTRALRYVVAEGKLPCGSYVDENGYKLGGWLWIQKIKEIHGDISEHRLKKLQLLPEWDCLEKNMISKEKNALIAEQKILLKKIKTQNDEQEDGFEKVN